MGINVQVNTDADPKKTTVSASGSIQHVITGNKLIVLDLATQR